MARVISIYNAKGGVAKTTTAVNLGAYLATFGRRTLLVDFDPQANASSALGGRRARFDKDVYHGVLGKAKTTELVKHSAVYNLHFIPSAPHLKEAVVAFRSFPKKEGLLRKFLHRLRHKYDYIIIDLSPGESLLTVNALVASEEIVIPVQAEYHSAEGLGRLLEVIEEVKRIARRPLEIVGALLTMHNKNERLSRAVARSLRAHFPHPVFKTEVPRSSALAEAPIFAKPVMLYRPKSPGALAYRRFAEEVIRQEKEPWMLYREFQSPKFGDFNV